MDSMGEPAGRRGRHKRLFIKIIVWAFFPTVLILGLVALVNFQAYQQVTEELVVQRNRELARLLAGRVSQEMADLAHRLEDFSDEASAQAADPLWLPSQGLYLQQAFPEFDGGIVISDLQADFSPVLAGTIALPDHAAHSPIADHISLRMRGPEDVVTTDAVPFQPGGESVVAVSVRYRGESGVLLGLSRVQPDMETGLYKLLSRLTSRSGGTVFVVDGNGQVIYHTQVVEIGKDYSGAGYIRDLMMGKVGSQRARSTGGQDVVVSYAPVLGTRWGLVIQENWETLTASSRGTLAFLLFLLGMGVLVPALVVSLAVRRIIQPIQELTLASREAAAGRFGRTVQANTGDEVEDLAEQFNRMSAQLQAYYTTLEQRVAERTRELAAVNAVASVVSGTLDLEEVLHRALEQTAQALDMEAGAVFLAEDGAGGLRLVVERGLSPAFKAQVERLPPGVGAAGQAAQSELPVVRRLTDYAREASEGDLRQAIEAEGLNLVVGIPLRAKGRWLGALNLCTHKERTLSAEELDMLTSIGSQVGVAIENARLYQKAEESAAVAERNRLARELHDAVTQTLFSVSLMADVLPRLWEQNPEVGRARLEEIRKLTRGALGEMRSLLIELRPQALVEAELKDLFRHLTDAFSGRELVPVALRIDGTCDLPVDVKVALYRITQEILNNIAKHASASQVTVTLECSNGRVELFVQDDGIGFDPRDIPPEHLGLGIMKERAQAIGAVLEIESRIGQGTEVRVVWEG